MVYTPWISVSSDSLAKSSWWLLLLSFLCIWRNRDKSVNTCGHYKCALQKPWWFLHQLLSPSLCMTSEALSGQDQEHTLQPTHSYAMEEDIDVTSHTEVIISCFYWKILTISCCAIVCNYTSFKIKTGSTTLSDTFFALVLHSCWC